MIDFNFNKDCCGCAACVDICPVNCIEIINNKKDFRIPKVDKIHCIDCKMCEKVCPTLNPSTLKYSERKLFCAYNNNPIIRDKGSSGSIFYTIAKRIIDEKGCVFGAAFDKHLQLRHVKAESIPEIYPLMKSKYIQSDTTGVYKKVQFELKRNRKVLFVGTPCQCQGLYNFLEGKKPENLIIIDFICHGVPSQKLFDNAIRQYEIRNECKVRNFSFRKKTRESLHGYSIDYENKSGELKNEEGISKEFPYYQFYLKYWPFRESCYICKFVGKDRISDLTLGDFWFLERIKPEIKDFNKGYSMLIVNSNKGKEILDVHKADVYSEEFDLQFAVDNNFAYANPTKKSIIHTLFIFDYNRIPYNKLEKRYFKRTFLKRCFFYLIHLIEK